MSRLLKFFACLFMLAVVSPVFAAGYTCPTSMKYTSCNDGYYLSDCGSGPFNGGTATGTTGNSCIACPTGYTCTGSNANCPVPATKSCPAGQYWSGGQCTACTAGSYCPGFENQANPIEGYGRAPCQIGSTSSSGASVCVPCPGGTTTSAVGQISCTVDCPGRANTTGWATPSWQAGAENPVLNLCVPTLCKGGYYLNNGVCVEAGQGYWSANNTATRSECPAGYKDNPGTTLSAENQCQLKTAPGKAVYRTEEGQIDCNGISFPFFYCPGNILVNYGDTVAVISGEFGDINAETVGGIKMCPSNSALDIFAIGTVGAQSLSDCWATTETAVDTGVLSSGEYLNADWSALLDCPVGYYCTPSTVSVLTEDVEVVDAPVYTGYGTAGPLAACPNGGTTASTGSGSINDCYKTGIAWSAAEQASRNGNGTKTCDYTSGEGTSAIYATNCRDYVLTSCNSDYSMIDGVCVKNVKIMLSKYGGVGVLSGPGVAANTADQTYVELTCVGTTCTLPSTDHMVRPHARLSQASVRWYTWAENETPQTVFYAEGATFTATRDDYPIFNISFMCDAGYSIQSNAHVCTPVGAGYYSAEDTNHRTKCPNGMTTLNTDGTETTTASSWQECASAKNLASEEGCASGTLIKRLISMASAVINCIEYDCTMADMPESNMKYAVLGNVVTSPGYEYDATLSNPNDVCSICPNGSYSAGGTNATCSVCPTGTKVETLLSETGATTGATMITQCIDYLTPVIFDHGAGTKRCSWNTSSSAYDTCFSVSTVTRCDAGYYDTGEYKNNANIYDFDCTAAGAGYWSADGVLTRTACPSGYNAGGTTIAAQSDCAIKTTAGNYIASANDTSLTLCKTGYYCPGDILVKYGLTGGTTQCLAGTFATTGASVCTKCVIGSYSSTDGASACKACGDGADWGKTTSAAGQTSCNATCTNAAGVKGWGSTVWNANNTVSDLCTPNSCESGNYKDGMSCLGCGTFANGLYPYSSSGTTGGKESCYLLRSDHKGAYINTAYAETTTLCPLGTYSDFTTEIAHYGQSYSCLTCPANTYAASMGTTRCTACLENYTTYGEKTSESACRILCQGGTYISRARDTECSSVGAGFWAPSAYVTQGSAGVRNACPAGNTTVGYGRGADEAADCGRILNLGSDKLYLRSQKKTTPSLNVSVGGTMYYANMSTEDTNMSDTINKQLKLNNSGTIYSVYDDSGADYVDGGTQISISPNLVATSIVPATFAGASGETSWTAILSDGTAVAGSAMCSTTTAANGDISASSFSPEGAGTGCWCQLTSPAQGTKWVYATANASCTAKCGYYCANNMKGTSAKNITYRTNLYTVAGIKTQ